MQFLSYFIGYVRSDRRGGVTASIRRCSLVVKVTAWSHDDV